MVNSSISISAFVANSLAASHAYGMVFAVSGSIPFRVRSSHSRINHSFTRSVSPISNFYLICYKFVLEESGGRTVARPYAAQQVPVWNLTITSPTHHYELAGDLGFRLAHIGIAVADAQLFKTESCKHLTDIRVVIDAHHDFAL